ncbi:MAG: branched-chain amino acid transaminase [Gammaproteobacteria bacterium]|nr:branched-chain amino acid transaminase [Gammaproteobacteria bacterium]
MAAKPEFIYFNGEIMPWENAKVHVLSHAIHYGSSVFEGVRAYNTPKGPAIFRHKEHTQRLFDSAKIYRIRTNATPQQIIDGTKAVIRANNMVSAYIRPVIFYGDIGLGLRVKDEAIADVAIAAMNWGTYLGDGALEQGVDVGISSWNRLAANTMPTGAKAGGNYLSSQLIGQEAKRHGYQEGIALDIHGYISEGAGENLFLVKNGKLYTPPTTSAILPGITRDTIMVLARDMGYDVVEQAIPREALYLADEIFMTGTAAEVTPARSVDGITVGTGRRGPITEKLQSAYFALVKGESEDKYGWLDYV